MTALAQIEQTLTKLTAGELAEVHTMLERLQKPNITTAVPATVPVRADATERLSDEQIQPLLKKPAAELSEDEVDMIVRYNGFTKLRRRSGPTVTLELVKQLMKEEGL